MPRFWALWLLSVILRGVGVVWLLFTVFAPIVLVLDQSRSSGAAYNFNSITAMLYGMTAVSLAVTFLFSLLYGLMIYAAGQFIVLMLQIETNTRGRRAAYAVPDEEPDDLPRPQPQRPAANQPMSEADRRALNASRRFQNPKREP